jgi:TolA-binding protein
MTRWCAIACLALSACFSSDEGEALKRDVEQLKKQLHKESGRAETSRQELQKVMEQATALLTRNNADVGAQVERVQTQAAKMVGDVEELQRSFAELKQKLDQLVAKVEVATETSQGAAAAQPQPEDRNEVYRIAQQKLASGDHTEARRLLRLFVTKFADDPRAGVAQRLLGDSYYSEQKFAPAIVEYRKVLETFKSSPAVGDALYKTGMSFYQLKFCGDAESFLKQFTQKFPRHADAQNAKKLLALIKRYKKNKAFCQS